MEENRSKMDGAPPTERLLDITNDVCPMTFVRARLLLEEMEPGESAVIHLCEGEPLRNVPANLEREGHRILALERTDTAGATDSSGVVWRLRFVKLAQSAPS